MNIALSPSSVRGCGLALAATAALALALAGCGSSPASSRLAAAPATATTSTSSNATAAGSTKMTSIATSKTTSTSDGVTSTDRRFVAAIPAGFRNAVAATQGAPINTLYLALGPRRGGFTTNINVVRESAAGRIDINAVVAAELKGIKRVLPQVRPISSPAPVTVAGEPARVVDYLYDAPTPHLRLRQVMLEHQGWIYVVTYTAPATAYTADLPALAQMISSWHWTSQ